MSLLELALASTADSADTPRSAYETAAPASRHWFVHFNDGRPPLEVIFSDDQTRGEVQASYPAAVQPAQEPSGRLTTGAERTELRDLVSRVMANDSPEDRKEAYMAALTEPDDALTCYRALSADLGICPTGTQT